MATDKKSKERKVATPKTGEKKAGKTTDTAQHAEASAPPGLIHLNEHEVPVRKPEKKSRKHAADLFDSPDDEPVETLTGNKPEKPQKKAKSGEERKVKQGEADESHDNIVEPAHDGDEPTAEKDKSQPLKKKKQAVRVEVEVEVGPSDPSSDKTLKGAEKRAKARAAKKDDIARKTAEEADAGKVDVPPKKNVQETAKQVKAAATKPSTSGKADGQPAPATKKGRGPSKADASKVPAKKQTKPSKEDGHPVAVEKTEPGGDSVEVEPKQAPQSKKAKPDKTKPSAGPAKEEKSEKIASKGSKVANDKPETVKKANKSAAKHTANSGKPEASRPAGQKSDAAEAELHAESGPNPLVASPVESLVKSIKDARPSQDTTHTDQTEDSARNPDVPKAAPTAKVKKGKKDAPNDKTKADSRPQKNAPTGSSGTAEGKKSQAPMNGGRTRETSKPGEKTTETSMAKPEKSKKRKGAPEAEVERAKPGSSAETSHPVVEKSKKRKTATTKDATAEQPESGSKVEASKPEAEKSKKRKNAPTHDVEAVKSDLLEPLAEAASAKKKQKKTKQSSTETASSAIGDLVSSGLEAVSHGVEAVRSDLLEPLAEAASATKKQKKTKPSSTETASSAIGDLVSSGLDAVSHGVEAAKEIVSGIASGTSKSIIGDVSEAALGAATEKQKKEKKESTKTSKRGKGKAGHTDTDEGDEPSKPAESDMPSGLDAGGETTLVAHEPEPDDESDYDDQTAALLKGFESDGDEADVDTSKGFTQGQEIPQLPDKNKKLSKQLKKVKGGDSDEPGVVYIGRIPHGFHEHEMRAYFSQFGAINHVRLSRSRKTGASKHFAFLEFASSEVAKIVADTMDNYIMFGHLLKCKLVAKEDVHPQLWKGADKRFKKVPWNQIEGRKLELAKGREEWERKTERERKRRGRKSEEAKRIGYEFEGGELRDVADVPVRESKGVEGVGEEGLIEGGEVREIIEQERSIVVAGGDESGIVLVSEEIVTKIVPAEKEEVEVPAAEASADGGMESGKKEGKKAKNDEGEVVATKVKKSRKSKAAA